MKVLIVTALSKEQNAITGSVGQTQRVNILAGTSIYIFFLKNNNYNDLIEVGSINLNATGNIEAAIKTTQAISYFNPDFVFLSGICGGFKNNSKINIGDIIIPEKIIYYEYGKIKDGHLSRRYLTIEIDSHLLSKIKYFASLEWNRKINSLPMLGNEFPVPRVHFNPIASGEKIIADEDIKLEFKNHFAELIGVEMESYGTAKAVLSSGKPIKFLVIKSIADWADTSKNDDWHEYATKISAEFIINLIENFKFN